jgi:hypothetical protein
VESVVSPMSGMLDIATHQTVRDFRESALSRAGNTRVDPT